MASLISQISSQFLLAFLITISTAVPMDKLVIKSPALTLEKPRVNSPAVLNDQAVDADQIAVNITFDPTDPLAPRMHAAVVNFTIFVTTSAPVTVFLTLNDTKLIRFAPDCLDSSLHHLESNCLGEDMVFNITTGTSQLNVLLQGIRIGKTFLSVHVPDESGPEGAKRELGRHPIVVVIEIPELTVIGLIVFICGMGLNLMGFGATVRTDMIKEMSINPRAIVISFCLQCVYMPMAAFVLGIIFNLPVHMRLALFICGCCPSGTPSNIYSLLFQGDVPRSVIMTIISTIATIVVMPYWVLTVGNSILQEEYPTRHIIVPWPQLVLYLLIFSVPGIIGVIVGCLAPLKVSRIIATFLRPIGILIGLAGAGLVLGTLGYIFEYAENWQTIIAPSCLPIAGCLVGLPLTVVLTKNNRLGITVGLETLFQNIALCVMWLGLNLPQPEALFALIIPGAVILSSVIEPLLVLPFVVMYRRCRCGRNKGDLSGTGSKKEKEAQVVGVPPRERKISIHYIL